MSTSTFAQEISKPSVDLVRAGLLFAREIAYPHLSVDSYVAQLDELASQAQDVVSASEMRPIALAHFLFKELQFRGNVADYGDPRNSYLNEVLERKLGIPITLSAIYLALARRLDVDAYGINLPGHFVVGAREGAEELLLDPFHEGARLTLEDCQELVRKTIGYEGALQKQWLRPAPTRVVLTRMLNNLRFVYAQRELWSLAVDVIDHLRQVQPDSPDHLRDLGLIHYQKGELYPAAQYLEAYLQEAPDTAEAAAIRQNMRPVFSRWARLN